MWIRSIAGPAFHGAAGALLIVVSAAAAAQAPQDAGDLQAMVAEPDAIQRRLITLQEEQASLTAENPAGEGLRRAILREIRALEAQLGFATDQQRRMALTPSLADASLDQVSARSAEAVRALASYDTNSDEVAVELAAVDAVDALRTILAQRIEPELRTRTDATRDLGLALDRLRADQSALPELITNVRRETERLRLELAGGEERLREELSTGDALVLRRSQSARRVELACLEFQSEALAERQPWLERAIRLRVAESAEAEAVRALRQRRFDSGQRRLRRQIVASQVQLRAEIDSVRGQLAKENLVPSQRSLLELELQNLEAALSVIRFQREVTELVERRQRIAQELAEAEQRRSFFHAIYGPGATAAPPPEEKVVEEILELRASSDRFAHRRDLTEIASHLDRVDQVESVRFDALELAASFDRAADRYLEQLTGEGAPPGSSSSIARARSRVDRLRGERRDLLGQYAQLLEEVGSALLHLRSDTEQLFEVRRSTLQLLRRENLFLRGQSSISSLAVAQAVDDLTAAPRKLAELALGATTYFLAPRHRLPVLGWLAGSLLAGWITSRVRRRLRAWTDGSAANARSFSSRLASFLGAVALAASVAAALALVPLLASALPELSAEVRTLLRSLALATGIWVFGAGSCRALFAPWAPGRACSRSIRLPAGCCSVPHA